MPKTEGFKIELVGINQVIKNMQDYRDKKNAETQKAVAESAEVAKQTAINLCPVSEDGSHGNPPGTLRDGNDTREVTQGETVTWELFNDVFYCGFVVLGTYKMKARDFMTPAAEAGSQALLQKMTVMVHGN